jgi:hypothetical protein
LATKLGYNKILELNVGQQSTRAGKNAPGLDNAERQIEVGLAAGLDSAAAAGCWFWFWQPRFIRRFGQCEFRI